MAKEIYGYFTDGTVYEECYEIDWCFWWETFWNDVSDCIIKLNGKEKRE
jgi:hypothetical protein